MHAGRNGTGLYDTFGFPHDLTIMMAEEKEMTVDMEAFNNEMKAQQEQSKGEKGASKNMVLEAEQTDYLQKANVAPTDDSSKYTWNITPMTKVKAIYTDDGFKDSATVGEYEVPPEPTVFGERALVYSDIVLGKGLALTIRLAMLSDVRCDARAPFSMPSC